MNSLENIFIPEGVREISYSAFLNCTSLKKVYISDNVYTIGYEAFANCTSLEEIHMSKELHRLGYEAFSGCTSLKLTIPDSVLRIGEKAFKDLPNVNYNGNAEGSPWWAKAINGVKSETKDGYIEVELNDEIFRQLGYEVERLGEDKEYLDSLLKSYK